MPRPIYLCGAALTPFGKAEGSLVELLAQAAQAALEQAEVSSVDAVYLGVMNPEEFTGEGNLAAALADRLDLGGAASSRVETASSTGAGALESAFFAVASGYRDQVLVVAGEKMTGLSTEVITRILAEVIAPQERAYGASMPALAALVARAYAFRYGIKEKDLKRALGAVAVKNHARGALNPFAQFQRPITLEQYLDSRPVSDPLSLYDCAPITDGAAAVVLSSLRGPVRLAGMGHATDSAALCRRGSLTSFNSTRRAARQAYAMAGLGPAEVDFAEVHDAFTIFEVIGGEDLGLFPAGQGWRAALEGRSQPGGQAAINASGGLKARGHPVGASGLAQVVEAFWLLTSRVSPERLLPRKPLVGLTQSIGGLGNNNLVTVLTRVGRRPGPRETVFPLRPEPPAPEAPRSLPPAGSGRLLSFTVLHRPPQGFAAPLPLGLVEAPSGWRSLAHLEGERIPPLGSPVALRLRDGLYRARALPRLVAPLARAGLAWRSWWRRQGPANKEAA